MFHKNFCPGRWVLLKNRGVAFLVRVAQLLTARMLGDRIVHIYASRSKAVKIYERCTLQFRTGSVALWKCAVGQCTRCVCAPI